MTGSTQSTPKKGRGSKKENVSRVQEDADKIESVQEGETSSTNTNRETEEEELQRILQREGEVTA